MCILFQQAQSFHIFLPTVQPSLLRNNEPFVLVNSTSIIIQHLTQSACYVNSFTFTFLHFRKYHQQQRLQLHPVRLPILIPTKCAISHTIDQPPLLVAIYPAYFSGDHCRLGGTPKEEPKEIAGARFFKQAGCLPVTQSPAHINASDSPATYGALQMCFDWLIDQRFNIYDLSLSHIKRYTKYFSVKTQAVTTYLYLLSQDLTWITPSTKSKQQHLPSASAAWLLVQTTLLLTMPTRYTENHITLGCCKKTCTKQHFIICRGFFINCYPEIIWSQNFLFFQYCTS